MNTSSLSTKVTSVRVDPIAHNLRQVPSIHSPVFERTEQAALFQQDLYAGRGQTSVGTGNIATGGIYL